MSGILIPLVPKRTFDFTHIQPAVEQDVIVRERIDVNGWADAVLVVRVHSANIGGITSISFSLLPDGWSDEDPGIRFLPATPLVTIFCPATGPALMVNGTQIFGHYLTLVTTGFIPTVASSTVVTASVDLILRSPDG